MSRFGHNDWRSGSFESWQFRCYREPQNPDKGMFRNLEHGRIRMRDLYNERGASLVIVAVMILVLTAMSTLVLDYGMVWAGRRQAQNAADAGALAAATALAKDDSTWPAIAPVVTGAGNGVAQLTKVMGATPGTEVLAQCPVWRVAPNNINCVEVNVYRDGTHGSTTMPVFFGRLIGQTSQSIKATATAQVVAANTSGCMRPWFIPEPYTDVNKNGMYDAPPDTITPYTVDPKPGDIGKAVVFHANSTSSAYGQLDVGSGKDDVKNAIEHCVAGVTFSVGDTVKTEPGNGLGPEASGIDALLTWDSKATWDPTKMEVVGGCAPAGTCYCAEKKGDPSDCPYGGTQSPRIVQAAICSPVEIDCSGTGGKGNITITNILSFFITGYTNSKGNLDINAILIGSAGMLEAGPVPAPGNSFITVEMLIR
jgi:Flp pilus assembly protein TadG